MKTLNVGGNKVNEKAIKKLFGNKYVYCPRRNQRVSLAICQLKCGGCEISERHIKDYFLLPEKEDSNADT